MKMLNNDRDISLTVGYIASLGFMILAVTIAHEATHASIDVLFGCPMPEIRIGLVSTETCKDINWREYAGLAYQRAQYFVELSTIFFVPLFTLILSIIYLNLISRAYTPKNDDQFQTLVERVK
jgi:hypothetical protein